MLKINSKRNQKPKTVSNSIAETYNKSSVAKSESQEVQENEEVAEEVIEDTQTNDEVLTEVAEEFELGSQTFNETEIVDFESMTKDELEIFARENCDLELDKRNKKSDLIEQIREALK